MDTLIRKLFTWGGPLLAVLLLLAFFRPLYRQGETSIAGKTAPEFSFTLAQKPATLADLRGQVVVLNFWATWCPPCVEETPALNRLQQHIAARRAMVLGISVDEDQSAYDAFLQKQGVVFPTYRDPTKKIALEYGSSMYPETYIIGRDGKLARKIIGPQKWDSPEMLAYFDALLGQN